ncbi:hypothetical protein [Photobacterium rosenbergii]|uniref:ABC-type transport auxiliary lipoprotein component domain-containing protein n=1 Tax=Photobacterium rosenbergii TaxID=294936 RepID=A0ABU3ZEI9_9GAMM|nr:hypothetical protein [Photobacterium rosenbergii]MDV5168526.1 hypothetical protein [Photobacterium rosenbergii]
MNLAKCLSLMLTAFLLVGVLAGCSVGDSIPQPTNYAMSASPPMVASARIGETLRIDHVRSVPPFNDTQMIYRLNEVRFEKDYYNRFISDPESILSNQLASWLQQSGLYDIIVLPSVHTPSNQVLQVTITKLFGDFRPGQQPTAVMEIQFFLVDNTDYRPGVVFSKTYTSRIPIENKSPLLLAEGYGVAMTRIFEQLTSELLRTRYKGSVSAEL